MDGCIVLWGLASCSQTPGQLPGQCAHPGSIHLLFGVHRMARESGRLSSLCACAGQADGHHGHGLLLHQPGRALQAVHPPAHPRADVRADAGHVRRSVLRPRPSQLLPGSPSCCVCASRGRVCWGSMGSGGRGSRAPAPALLRQASPAGRPWSGTSSWRCPGRAPSTVPSSAWAGSGTWPPSWPRALAGTSPSSRPTRPRRRTRSAT